jgi:hypothetical protein
LPVLRTLLLTLFVTASALVSGRAHAEDTLWATDGMRTGTVEGYAGGICTFDGAAIPCASIYYIGLDAGLSPPAPQDPMRDEVHLRDGSVHAGPLVSIDADNVATESASFARKEVAWIWLTPMLGGQGQTAPSTTAEEEGAPTYEWAGTVTIENRYNGEVGRHLWQAEYRVKFLEVPEGATSGRAGNNYPTAYFRPIDLSYAFHADQNWDRGSHALQTNAAGEIIYADVTMRGTASGRLDRDEMLDGPYGRYGAYGNMVRILTPLPATQEVPESLVSGFDYYDYADNIREPVEAGWYVIYVGHFPYDSPQERRAYYRGIERGGREPPAFPDPDEDFLHWIPSGMHGETLIGRLDRPEQAEVRGRHTYPEQGPGGTEDRDREQITIEWSFTRARVPDQP